MHRAEKRKKMKKVSEILKKYQRENHYTYQKLADHLKMSKSTVYAYIKETRNPSIKSIETIANYLNLPIEMFFEKKKSNQSELEFLRLLHQKPEIYQFLLKNPENSLIWLEKMYEKR